MCQSIKYWNAAIRNEPEPQAGSTDAEFRHIVWLRSLEQWAEGRLDDVVDDGNGGVVDTARLAYFRLLFDGGLVAFDRDRCAEELLVNAPEYVSGHYGELVREGLIETSDYVAQGVVRDLQCEADGIGFAVLILGACEVEETRVVAIISSLEQSCQPCIDVGTFVVDARLQFAECLKPTRLSDPQEDDAIDEV